MVQKAASDFAQKAKQGVIERDTHMTYPKNEVKEMGDLGFMGIMSSPEYGGSGLDTLSYVLVMEELSKIDASSSVIMSAHNSLAVYGIEKYGTEEIKNKYLSQPPVENLLGVFVSQNQKLEVMQQVKKPQQWIREIIIYSME